MIDEAKEAVSWSRLREMLDLARQLPPGEREEWIDDANMFALPAFDEPDFGTPEGRTINLLLKIAELARALADEAEGATAVPGRCGTGTPTWAAETRAALVAAERLEEAGDVRSAAEAVHSLICTAAKWLRDLPREGATP